MRVAVSVLRRGGLAAAGAGSIIAAAVGMTAVAPVAVLAATAPTYSVANVGAYGGEPSIVSDRLGRLYDTTPSGGTIAYTSTDHGATWQQVTTADPNSGDDCLATDQANAVTFRLTDLDAQLQHWRAIYDDRGRIMVAMCFNQDNGDAWEWADSPNYPEKFASQAFRTGINYIIYSMTH